MGIAGAPPSRGPDAIMSISMSYPQPELHVRPTIYLCAMCAVHARTLCGTQCLGAELSHGCKGALPHSALSATTQQLPELRWHRRQWLPRQHVLQQGVQLHGQRLSTRGLRSLHRLHHQARNGVR